MPCVLRQGIVKYKVKVLSSGSPKVQPNFYIRPASRFQLRAGHLFTASIRSNISTSTKIKSSIGMAPFQGQDLPPTQHLRVYYTK